MKIHELTLTKKTDRKRVGRGIGSGYGKTAGRGTKGQNSRTGGGVRPGFEGGQNPLAKRLPKARGFKSLNPTIYQVINTGELSGFKAGATVDAAALRKAGLIRSVDKPVKLLAHGELTHKLTIKAQAASRTAKAAVEAAGGTVELIELVNPKPVKAAA
jgi:large subunit ribosomal protein L15